MMGPGPAAASPCPVAPCNSKESEGDATAVPADSSALAWPAAPAWPMVSSPSALPLPSPVKSVCANPPPAMPWLMAFVTPGGN